MSTKKPNLAEVTAKLDELTELVKSLKMARGTREGIKPPKSAEAFTLDNLVLKDIQEHPGTVRKDIAQRLHIPPIKVTKSVTALASEDKLVKLGDRRTTRWFSPEVLASLRKP